MLADWDYSPCAFEGGRAALSLPSEAVGDDSDGDDEESEGLDEAHNGRKCARVLHSRERLVVEGRNVLGSGNRGL